MTELKLAFADNLRTRRARKHWSRQQLAAVSGVSAAAIEKYERCLCSPILENVAKLSNALDCTPNDLCAFPEFK